MLQKLHGKKLHVSVSFYDKLVRQQQMHQEGTLSLVEAQTVDQSVREDITAHSSFIQSIAAAARKKLRTMSEADRKFFDFISPEEFLQGTPQPTVWWLQRAIYLLSHRREQGRWLRYSFATWLVPFVEQQLLHFDVVASITTEGYHALLALNDPVAVAWRSDPRPAPAIGRDVWPGSPAAPGPPSTTGATNGGRSTASTSPARCKCIATSCTLATTASRSRRASPR